MCVYILLCFQIRCQDVKDLTDIANGDYPLKMLKQDIIDTWNINSEVEKIKFKNEIKGKR